MFGIVQNRPKRPPVETTAFLFWGYEKLPEDWKLSVAAKSELSIYEFAQRITVQYRMRNTLHLVMFGGRIVMSNFFQRRVKFKFSQVTFKSIHMQVQISSDCNYQIWDCIP